MTDGKRGYGIDLHRLIKTVSWFFEQVDRRSIVNLIRKHVSSVTKVFVTLQGILFLYLKIFHAFNFLIAI